MDYPKFIVSNQKEESISLQGVMVTTDTNNHISCMTKHILPYNSNICYSIYLKLTDINGLGMPGTNKVHWTIYKIRQELLPLFIILPLFCMGKLQKGSKSSKAWKLLL